MRRRRVVAANRLTITNSLLHRTRFGRRRYASILRPTTIRGGSNRRFDDTSRENRTFRFLFNATTLCVSEGWIILLIRLMETPDDRARVAGDDLEARNREPPRVPARLYGDPDTIDIALFESACSCYRQV